MMVIQDVIKIRAHHLLCMQGFQGYGYSKDFTTNMAQVIKNLKSPNREIEIIAECDAICLPCPHKKDRVCRKNPSSTVELKNIDTYILKKLGFENGSKIKAEDIFPFVKTKLNDSDIKYICGDCQWVEKCLLASSYENI